jgi:ceramide glucosyltransferase
MCSEPSGSRPCGRDGGAFVTHGFALALLFLAAMGFAPAGWAALCGVTAVRVAAALTIAVRYTGDRAVPRALLWLPVSDLLGAALYVASYCGSHVVWRGERFRLLRGGRLERVDQPPRS